MSSSVSFDCRHAYSAGFQLDAQFEADSQVTALFGPSGSGKTTIVRLLSGLLKPDRGRIRLGDRVVTDTQSGLFLRPEQRRVGLLFQHHCLFPHQRVRANISYGISRRGAGGISMERIGRIRRNALWRSVPNTCFLFMLSDHGRGTERMSGFS
ncbi:MAG: ATP-binding cassette domain-containing protein, partial [Pirellulaceae bacterium]|nr:ATP-binding cassette domain-containing protein [Pirellulaceae bacterium]